MSNIFVRNKGWTALGAIVGVAAIVGIGERIPLKFLT
jgi:hypothetical protein